MLLAFPAGANSCYSAIQLQLTTSKRTISILETAANRFPCLSLNQANSSLVLNWVLDGISETRSVVNVMIHKFDQIWILPNPPNQCLLPYPTSFSTKSLWVTARDPTTAQRSHWSRGPRARSRQWSFSSNQLAGGKSIKSQMCRKTSMRKVRGPNFRKAATSTNKPQLVRWFTCTEPSTWEAGCGPPSLNDQRRLFDFCDLKYKYNQIYIYMYIYI